MKRFWRTVAVEPAEGGWRVTLDGRGLKTPLRANQVVPTRALADALADEWRSQGEDVDPAGFALRDLADFALDVVRPDPAAATARLLAFAETDTLCYRAEPDEPLAARQRALWEPLLKAAETRHGVRFERVVGVMHRPQPRATIARLRDVLVAHDPFTLAALHVLASLAASLTVALAAIEPETDPEALFAVANLEEDWQAEQWGEDAEAIAVRSRRFDAFCSAARFARLAVA